MTRMLNEGTSIYNPCEPELVMEWMGTSLPCEAPTPGSGVATTLAELSPSLSVGGDHQLVQ